MVETAHRVTEQRQSQWRQQRVRTEAVAKLIEKEKLKHQAKLAKAEQKMLDEFATNQFYARRRSGETGM